MNKTEIRHLITQNRLDEAISALIAKTEGTHLRQLAILIAGQHADLKKQHIIAIESSAELEQRRNHIARAALQLLEDLPDESLPFSALLRRYKTPLLAVLAAAIALAIWWGYPRRNDEPEQAKTETAFQAALAKSDIPALDTFLLQYPSSPFSDKARIQRMNLQNTLNAHLKTAEALYQGGQL